MVQINVLVRSQVPSVQALFYCRFLFMFLFFEVKMGGKSFPIFGTLEVCHEINCNPNDKTLVMMIFFYRIYANKCMVNRSTSESSRYKYFREEKKFCLCVFGGEGNELDLPATGRIGP